MSDLDDLELDGLLREAEARLSGSRKQHSSPRVSATLKSTSSSTGLAPRESLSVRRVRAKKTAPKDNAGQHWFHLPKADVTPEFKRDWQILRMRNILDPSQQRKALRAEMPKYAQVGEIIAGPTDFYSARLLRKERKRNLLQEALSHRDDAKMRRKYADIQREKTSGKKGSYRKFLGQRKKWKG